MPTSRPKIFTVKEASVCGNVEKQKRYPNFVGEWESLDVSEKKA